MCSAKDFRQEVQRRSAIIVVGVFIFTALTYSLTILGIDTNLQFVFSGIIILVAVALDCLKYVQKK